MKKLRREVAFPVREREQLTCSTDQIEISVKNWQVDFTLVQDRTASMAVQVFAGYKNSPQFMCPMCNKSTNTLRGLENEPLSLGCPSCRKPGTSLSRYGIRGRSLLRQLSDIRDEIEELGGMEINNPLMQRTPDDSPISNSPRLRNLLAKEQSLVWRLKLGEISTQTQLTGPISENHANEAFLLRLINELDESTVGCLEAIADSGGSIVELSAELGISVHDWIHMCNLSSDFAIYSEFLYTKTQAAQLKVCRDAITRPAAAQPLTRWLDFNGTLDRLMQVS